MEKLCNIMRPPRPNPRTDYRRQEHQGTEASASLSEKFPELKSLAAEFVHFKAGGINKSKEIKFTLHPEHAKAVFRVDCANQECVGGDVDLSMALAKAVATGLTTATGEMCCQGWANETKIDQVHCHSVLRYKLKLGY